MKYLFIVQGEGRGHLTQAITLENMLRRNGHEVVEILVGKSSARRLPGFFNRTVHAPVKRFISPNFLPSVENKRANIGKSVVYNLVKGGTYLKSMLFIKERIEKSGADIVINFYELLTGLTYAFMSPSIPYICIGHQYMFLHQNFEFPKKNMASLFMLRIFTRMTSIGCRRRLALSFYEEEDDKAQRIKVIPPLLRSEVNTLRSENKGYIHGYMVNSGFADSVSEYHKRHPSTVLHFFWDKTDTEEETKLSPNLTFHQIDDMKFLKYMSGCKAFASTAGFESVCEAMYLGKPILMVPVHIEQDCNAHDAVKAGAGIISTEFNLEELENITEYYHPNREFVYWTNSCERVLMQELEESIYSSGFKNILSSLKS